MKKAVLIFLFLVNLKCFSQKEQLSFGYGTDLAERIDIDYLPHTGNFYTIQLITVVSSATYDREFFSHFLILKPLFVQVDSSNRIIRRYSLGVYNSEETAEQHCQKIKPLFPDAFVVAYSDGKRMQKEHIGNGNADEKKINFKSINKTCKKALKNTYWRLQFGYYEKDSLEGDERELYQKLTNNGISTIQEKYEKGKLYVSSVTYKSYEEAKKAQEQAEIIAERDIILKPYFDFPDIRLEVLERIGDCIRK